MEVLGFRGFKTLGAINFAVPNGRYGSGLTTITGPNNAGKSSVLECLKARAGREAPSFTVGSRNISVEEVSIKYVINGEEEFIKSIRKGSSETKKVGVNPDFHVFVLPSRRAFSPYFSRSESSRGQYLANWGLTHQRSTTLSGFESRLFTILKNQAAFNEILHEILTFKPEWSIDQSDQGQYFLKFFNGNDSHSSDGMGEGVVSIFAIVDSLYDSKPGDVVVIDEPELSLHPALQKRVANVLCRFASDRQIVISTHSPYFVNLEALSSGGQLARVTTGGEGTLIHEISDAAKESIRKLSRGNLYNPHVFGLDARELFFQEDKIILTEGQEDVLLFPYVAQQIEADIAGTFFGWGAGGASNIWHLCRILKDLGYKKVAGLLDGDKIDEKERLEAEFTEFLFVCIPAKDIRTKPARKATDEVQGLLDEDLKLKDEYVIQLKALFESLSRHMNS
ncbi:ATP-binding protein [Chromobacterium sp. IRSSSOUMB001]|uniref:ATP-dependent nuclease n=1 Tax=Chromobacterium sp. IRSSSOUMB001 TaxID=2927123 RepID=UPI0020BE1C02|nr:ATP-binding protein [Chromobacterium sp. IRSSSOUMB001]